MEIPQKLLLGLSGFNPNQSLCLLPQAVNKDCKSSWMKHTIETANGNKIITRFILMIKNITHLADQLRHAVTSF